MVDAETGMRGCVISGQEQFLEPYTNALATIDAQMSPQDVEMTLAAMDEFELANEVVVVSNGAEALDYLYGRGRFAQHGNGLPVVVLLDLKMPKVDGLEVLRQLKADPELRRIPRRHDHVLTRRTGSRPQLRHGRERVRRETRRFPTVHRFRPQAELLLGDDQRAAAAQGWRKQKALGVRPSACS
jgi:CheY-like chemotaxis protein